MTAAQQPPPDHCRPPQPPIESPLPASTPTAAPLPVMGDPGRKNATSLIIGLIQSVDLDKAQQASGWQPAATPRYLTATGNTYGACLRCKSLTSRWQPGLECSTSPALYALRGSGQCLHTEVRYPPLAFPNPIHPMGKSQRVTLSMGRRIGSNWHASGYMACYGYYPT
jgi:hypothetical protein